MHKLGILVATTLVAVGLTAAGLIGAGPAGAKSSKPVTLDGKVNVKGKQDVSSKTSATIELEADDYYFSPTFVKVAPGEKVTIELENEGNASHTFTSDALNVDKQLAPGKKSKFTVTVPDDATVLQFHCTFHESMGMQGAFYTKPGVAAEKTSSTKAPSSGVSMGY